MITEQLVYKCECDKCGYIWTPKTNTVPARCASCNVKTWHDQTGEIVALDMPKVRMTYDAIFDVVQGMSETDRGTLIDAFRPREVAKPSQPMQDEPKDALSAFIAKAQAKKGIVAEIVEDVIEVAEQWNWTKDAPQFADDGNVYRRQWLAVDGKPKFRTVRVDPDDHSAIV